MNAAAITSAPPEKLDSISLFESIYPSLYKAARKLFLHEKPGHTLTATGLVHEAFIRITGNGSLQWESKQQFVTAVVTAMRRELIDSERRRRAYKRGSHMIRHEFSESLCVAKEPSEDLLAVHCGLSALEKQNPKSAEVISFVYFGGMKVKEVAELLGISEKLASSRKQFGRVWIQKWIREGNEID